MVPLVVLAWPRAVPLAFHDMEETAFSRMKGTGSGDVGGAPGCRLCSCTSARKRTLKVSVPWLDDRSGIVSDHTCETVRLQSVSGTGSKSSPSIDRTTGPPPDGGACAVTRSAPQVSKVSGVPAIDSLALSQLDRSKVPCRLRMRVFSSTSTESARNT